MRVAARRWSALSRRRRVGILRKLRIDAMPGKEALVFDRSGACGSPHCKSLPEIWFVLIRLKLARWRLAWHLVRRDGPTSAALQPQRL
jgi:hypothetical protein